MISLYSSSKCPFSHCCRIVLFEKGMDFQIIDVDKRDRDENFTVINPYRDVPVLAERDLFLCEPRIINEYIDEHFPHPRLMPADPAMRARARLILFWLEHELFCHMKIMEDPKACAMAQDQARTALSNGLTLLAPQFQKSKYMFGEEFSMLDVAIGPLLWRLEHYGIDLQKHSASVLNYGKRLFSRQSFMEALTPFERAMRSR